MIITSAFVDKSLTVTIQGDSFEYILPSLHVHMSAVHRLYLDSSEAAVHTGSSMIIFLLQHDATNCVISPPVVKA